MLASLSGALGDVKRSVRYAQHSRGFLRRFKSWMASKVWASGDHELLLSAFISSKGSLLSQASELLTLSEEDLGFPESQSSIGLIRGSHEYNDALSQLRSEGFAILPWLLPDRSVRELTECIQRCRGRFVGDRICSGDGSHRILRDEDLLSPLSEKFAIHTEDLIRQKSLTDLAMDPGVLALAQDYLGAVPKLDIFTSWYSFPVGRSSNEAATEFHYDLDRTKWLKFFYFLTDVDTQTGAHVFIPGTHRDGGIPRPLLNRGYSRIPDEEINKYFPKVSWSLMEGSRGSILVEDTRGLHKGMPLLAGHRLLLQFQYSQNLFGSVSLLAQVDKSDWIVDTQLPSSYKDVVLAAFQKT